MSIALAAAGLSLALCACRTQALLPGGDGGGTDAAVPPDLGSGHDSSVARPDLAGLECGSLAAGIKAWLDAHHACQADSDCVSLSTACGLGEYTCDAVVNGSAQTATLTQELADWENRCDATDCLCPGLHPQVACNAGLCGVRLVDSGAVGDACSSGLECQTGQCATTADDPGFVGGYCTVFDCDPKKPVCPANSECAPVGGRYYCLAQCGGFVGNAHPCRSGYGCCTGPGPVFPDEPGQCAPQDSSWCAP